MEVKDTVMSDKELQDGYFVLTMQDLEIARQVAQEQAEISFKAGKDEGRFEAWSIIVASRQGELRE